MPDFRGSTGLSGHAAHTQAAAETGLPGDVRRPINVVFLGAGSGFCPTLCRDILMIPGNRGGELRLVDTDAGRLAAMHRVIQRLIDESAPTSDDAAAGWTVVSSADRREVLPGAHYAVCCVEVAGLACVNLDNDIPLAYGVDQCIGDTTGPGGLFKGLRTIPVFLDILRDMREMCPGAPMLNYTNPMSMMVLAAGRAVPEVPVVGLCHSVQGSSRQLAGYAGVDYDEMDWACAGINHLAWFTRCEHRGEDLYAKVLYENFRDEVARAIEEAKAGRNRHDDFDVKFMSEDERERSVGSKLTDVVRKDMCVHFGAYITESSGHLSEYLPYYRKSDAGRQLLRVGYDGGSRFYASNWPGWRRDADALRQRMVDGEEPVAGERSFEYGSWIIEAMEKDAPQRIHGNVMNHGAAGVGGAGKLITNLPGDGCVEVACMVDGNGVNPTRFGALPPQMAHVCAHAMATYDLAATAVIERSKEAAVHALMLDPLTSAVLTPGEIRALTLEMFEAQSAWLPGYR